MHISRTAEADRAELEHLRAGVNCATVLERAGFTLDRRESTRRSPKYRDGNGRIVIVSHEGQGWWDPHDPRARGDVFALVQHLNPGMNLGHVRQALRSLVGLSPSAPAMAPRHRSPENIPPHALWTRRAPPRRGSAAWGYLAGQRGLPEHVIDLAVSQDALREGVRGTTWFAHRSQDGRLSGFEMRGPSYRGFSTGGTKTLFEMRAGGEGEASRLVVCEAPIDVLSFAALNPDPTPSILVATSGGMGPATTACIENLLEQIGRLPRARVILATDNDEAGERYAATLRELADRHCIWSGRALPPGDAKDWNDALRAGQTERVA